MSADQIDAEAALLEKKLKALQELKLAKSGQPSQSSQETSTSTSDGAAAASTDRNKDQIPRRPRPSEIRITVGSKKMVVKQ